MPGLAESTRAKLKERKNDLNETPPEAVAALLANTDLPTCLWEPACGPGAIVRVLRTTGRVVWATDLVDYKSPDQDHAGWDFLMEKQLPIGTQAIITNPPFKLAALFAQHALHLGVAKVYMLMRLQFLEAGNEKTDAGSARLEVLDGGKLEKVLVFRNRLPMMHREGWAGKRIAFSRTAFAWFIWDQHAIGPATVERISW